MVKNMSMLEQLRYISGLLPIVMLLMAAAPSPSLAQADATTGVIQVQTAISQIRQPLRSEYFIRPSNIAPQWTPDGGIFQYYSGRSGEGAIYWRPGATAAFLMYGSILQEFKNTGFEAKNGYPDSNEEAAPPNSICNDPSRGVVATREQWFYWGHVMCFSPSRGVWHVYQGI